MSIITFEFDMKKTVETIIYLINRIPDPTFMSVAKLLYFADKTSLESFGRYITGDTYCAMQNGPVPSNAYDIMKAARDNDVYGFEVVNHYHLQPLRDADLDELSESDTDCLDKIINAYGNYPWWHLRDMSHDLAWTKTWAMAGERGSTPIPVEQVIEMFDNADELIDYLKNLNNE